MESVWRFESVHGFASVGNLYQKMHFAGSNLSTDPKCPKCIYKISKNFRVEKSGEISRNLRFSRFSVPASKSDTHHGWGGRIRTDECQSQSLVPYRLATPQYRDSGTGRPGRSFPLPNHYIIFLCVCQGVRAFFSCRRAEECRKDAVAGRNRSAGKPA